MTFSGSQSSESHDDWLHIRVVGNIRGLAVSYVPLVPHHLDWKQQAKWQSPQAFLHAIHASLLICNACSLGTMQYGGCSNMYPIPPFEIAGTLG